MFLDEFRNEDVSTFNLYYDQLLYRFVVCTHAFLKRRFKINLCRVSFLVAILQLFRTERLLSYEPSSNRWRRSWSLLLRNFCKRLNFRDLIRSVAIVPCLSKPAYQKFSLRTTRLTPTVVARKKGLLAPTKKLTFLLKKFNKSNVIVFLNCSNSPFRKLSARSANRLGQFPGTSD